MIFCIFHGDRGIVLRALSQDSVHAHDRVLNVGSGFAFEAERIFEIEGDHRGAREAQQEISQRADGDRVRNGGALGFRRVRMPRVHFLARACFELVEQVVGFHALAFAAAHFDVGFLGVLGGNFVAHFEGAARRERDDVVGKMLQMIGLLVVSQRAQARDDHLLRIRLPGVDHVEHFVRVAECWRARIVALAGGDPGLVAVRMLVKAPVVEIAVEQAEFPEVVGDVLADVGDGAVGAHDDFRFGFFGRLFGRASGFSAAFNSSAASRWDGSCITQQPAFLPEVAS